MSWLLFTTAVPFLRVFGDGACADVEELSAAEQMRWRWDDYAVSSDPRGPEDAAAAADGVSRWLGAHMTPPLSINKWTRLREQFGQRLSPAEQAAVLSWASFTTMFTGLRLLTHWIHRGHGPQGGGISVGGRHFHHYNIGIALLSAVGAVGLRGSDRQRRHPAVAVAYGTANALVVDELALLLDLKDVYWSHDGRESVDVAIALIALGATAAAGMPFWPHARRVLRTGFTRSLGSSLS